MRALHGTAQVVGVDDEVLHGLSFAGKVDFSDCLFPDPAYTPLARTIIRLGGWLERYGRLAQLA